MTEKGADRWGSGADGWWRERSSGLGSSILLEADSLHREESAFQTIEILEHRAFGRILALDGYIQACAADEFIYHEMAVHVPLLGRPREQVSVLIVGGGDGGILREVLVHEFVTAVTMVEIDRRVIELSNEYLGLGGDYDDPRVTLTVANAREFVARARAEMEAGAEAGSGAGGQRYDLIILDLTEPVGPSATLFTEAFIADLCHLLSDEGVIVDSDSLFLSLSGGRFLQEESVGEGENLVTTMRRTGLVAGFEVYRARVPSFPGADFGFFLYSRDAVSLATPARLHTGRHYSPEIHRAAFILPPWQQDWLRTGRERQSAPSPC